MLLQLWLSLLSPFALVILMFVDIDITVSPQHDMAYCIDR